ncbi:MAG TPA: hypothetical protein H9779_06870 [Candidatus Alistipes avicola]|uniref:Aminopeptidase n=1 Tax=Candidatus Alistipes avicola TaxID=2838432 RepID=A0A9D2L4V3_9BACT|nr:hypothetical protein [Candidatus Alistipes avicola]
MRRLFSHLLILCLLGATACTSHFSSLSEQEKVLLERFRTIRLLQREMASILPGFDDPNYIRPLLYYTDSICYVMDPGADFQEQFAARLVYRDDSLRVYKTSLPDSIPFHMETQVDFLDSTAFNYWSPYLYCSSPEIVARSVPDVTTDNAWFPMVLHECAHGYQYAHPWLDALLAHALPMHGEMELARLHLQYDWFNELIEVENRAILDAVDADDASDRNSHIRTFLMSRKARKERMAQELSEEAVRDEEFYEYMEGLARYIEAEVGFRLGCYSQEKDTWLFDTNRSGYFFATGYNLMRLFDRLGVDKSSLYTDSFRPLEDFVREAVNQQ